MPRRPRAEVEGALYHIIARGNHREVIFHSEDDHRKFLSLLATAKQPSPHYLYASDKNMKNPNEVYQFIDDLITRLISAGDEVAAKELSLAMTGGSTGTEVFMELRFQLEKILSTGVTIPVEYKKKTIDALSYINSELSR
jgi:hypothetical protein